MDDLLENNLESEIADESNEINTDNTELTNDSIDNLDEDLASEEENIIEKTEDIIPPNTEVANSLALTIKKDYNLAIAKNIFVKTLRSTWKIVLSVFTLNFLKFFL